jgi:hypothetical protein
MYTYDPNQKPDIQVHCIVTDQYTFFLPFLPVPLIPLWFINPLSPKLV